MTRRLPLLALAFLLLAALAVLFLRPDNYAAQDRDAPMAAASHRHPAGTDQLGRDRAVRVAAALVLGLAGAAAAAAVTTALAALVGLTAGFTNPAVSAILLFLSDAFLSLPWVFLLMIVRSLLPLTATPMQSAITTFLVLAVLGWPACARAVYHGALSFRSAEWMLHARASGLRQSQIIRAHVLPNLRPLLLPQFLICIPAFIVAEANLGVLGLGVAEPLPSWGSMLLDLDNSALLAQSHWVYLPILVLVLVLLLLESLTSEA